MLTQEQVERNIRFNRMIAALPKRTQVIGQMADGSPLTVEVPTLTLDGGK